MSNFARVALFCHIYNSIQHVHAVLLPTHNSETQQEVVIVEMKIVWNLLNILMNSREMDFVAVVDGYVSMDVVLQTNRPFTQETGVHVRVLRESTFVRVYLLHDVTLRC